MPHGLGCGKRSAPITGTATGARTGDRNGSNSELNLQQLRGTILMRNYISIRAAECLRPRMLRRTLASPLLVAGVGEERFARPSMRCVPVVCGVCQLDGGISPLRVQQHRAAVTEGLCLGSGCPHIRYACVRCLRREGNGIEPRR